MSRTLPSSRPGFACFAHTRDPGREITAFLLCSDAPLTSAASLPPKLFLLSFCTAPTNQENPFYCPRSLSSLAIPFTA